MLKLSEENIELKFEAEQARKDVPRLKVGVKLDGILFFVLKMFAFYIYCIYSSALQTRFFLGSKQYEPLTLKLKVLLGTLSECQTVRIQIRTVILSVLIWVQTVCKAFKVISRGQVTPSKKRVEYPHQMFWLRNKTIKS